MYILIALFSISVLGIAVMIGIKLAASKVGAFDDDVPPNEFGENDFLFIFSPVIILMARKGVFSGTKRMYVGAIEISRNGVKRTIEWTRRKAHHIARNIAEKTGDKNHTPYNRGAASFYLKDITEHKKKIASERREVEYEIYEGESEDKN